VFHLVNENIDGSGEECGFACGDLIYHCCSILSYDPY
jgi:hypothetical protein